MLAGMIYTELLKMKRSVLPWMIAVGGIMPAGVALLTLSNGNSGVTWNALAASGLNCMNMAALLLVAVYTGLIFAGEYGTNTVSVMFTYPVSRFGFYISKLITVLLVVLSVYLLSFVSTFAFGFTGIQGAPAGDFVMRFLEFTLLSALLNFVPVPVTILVCSLAKGVAASVVSGMCYILVYMSFINSESSLYIPACTPTRVVSDSFVSGSISRADVRGLVLAAAITFTVSLIISGVYYSKSDVHK